MIMNNFNFSPLFAIEYDEVIYFGFLKGIQNSVKLRILDTGTRTQRKKARTICYMFCLHYWEKR